MRLLLMKHIFMHSRLSAHQQNIVIKNKNSIQHKKNNWQFSVINDSRVALNIGWRNILGIKIRSPLPITTLLFLLTCVQTAVLDLMPCTIPFPLAMSDYQGRTMSVPERSLQIGGGEPNMANIERMRNHSELLRAECLRLVADAGKQCKRMQNEEQQLGKPDKRRLGSIIAEGKRL